MQHSNNINNIVSGDNLTFVLFRKHICYLSIQVVGILPLQNIEGISDAVLKLGQ
jgi:hypothetical protein